MAEVERAFVVRGSVEEWERRCHERLDRRPFRVVGWAAGQGPRELAVEYRNRAGVVHAVVFVSVMKSTEDETYVQLLADNVVDSPIRVWFGSNGEKAIRKADGRLRGSYGRWVSNQDYA